MEVKFWLVISVVQNCLSMALYCCTLLDLNIEMTIWLFRIAMKLISLL